MIMMGPFIVFFLGQMVDWEPEEDMVEAAVEDVEGSLLKLQYLG